MKNVDLEQFEGKEVIWSNRYYNGENAIIPGIIVGFDYYIGLSIVNKDDKTDELTCIHGPSYNHPKSNYDSETYDAELKQIVKMLSAGYFDGVELYGVDITMPSIHGMSCPFKA